MLLILLYCVVPASIFSVKYVNCVVIYQAKYHLSNILIIPRELNLGG